MRRYLGFVLLGLIALVACSSAGSKAAKPDPRLAGAYIRPAQDGWYLVHLQGPPGTIGYQNGYLLAPRIEDLLKVVELEQTHDSHRPWSFFRTEAKEEMWPHIGAEYQQELQGIADGVKAHGGHVDVWDITAMNALEEWSYFIEQWDKDHPQQKVAEAQHRAGATGPQPGASISGSLGTAERGPAPIEAHYPGAGEHCSAFVAAGAYTTDGKIVIAHNDWANYLDGERWNIIYDIVPQHGYRFVMDGLPGIIHSADDFGENADGILITETTISDFHGYAFNKIPEFVRARKAMQYASSIRQFAQIMEDGNNGGYANNWLVGDTKNNEIADLELGLKVVTLYTSKSGFFVGSNFPVNPKLAKEETTFNLKDSANSENARHTRWLELMKQYKGKIDVAAARKFESDHYDVILRKINPDFRTLCGHGEGQPTGDIPLDMGAVEGKATDAALAAHLSFWAVEGRPCGQGFVAATFLKTHPQFGWEAPELRDMPGHSWTEIRVSGK